MYGEILEAKRKALGLSQEGLAHETGISVKSIRRYEAGERKPQIEKAIILSDLFGCSIDELLGREETSRCLEGKEIQTVHHDLKTLQRRLCDLIGAIEKLHSECDTPEEVMRLLLDVGDNGEINHPENRAFIDLLETLAPLAGEILRSIRRGERIAS